MLRGRLLAAQGQNGPAIQSLQQAVDGVESYLSEVEAGEAGGRAIRDRYAEYKAAVVGERGLELPMPPTISDVARSAQGLSATPVTAGELFPD